MAEVGEVSKVMIHGLQMNYFLPAYFCLQSLSNMTPRTDGERSRRDGKDVMICSLLLTPGAR